MEAFRPDRPHVDVHEQGWNWGQYWNSFTETGKGSIYVGGLALGVATLGLLLIKTSSEAMPQLWGTLPAGAVVGLSTAAAIPLSHRVANSIITDEVEEEEEADHYYNRDNARILTSFVVTLLATALCTTTFSSMICPHRVSYLGAVGYGIVGGLAAGIATKIDLDEEKTLTSDFIRKELQQRHEAYLDQQQEREYSDYKMEMDVPDQAPRREEEPQPLPMRSYDRYDYLRIGTYSLAAGAATTVVPGVLLVIGALWTRLCGDCAPMIKGAVTVGAIGGVATSIAVYTADLDKYNEWKESSCRRPKPFPTWDCVARVAVVFTAIVALSPTASKYLSSYQVSYLQAAGMSVGAVAGGVGLFAGALYVFGDE